MSIRQRRHGLSRQLAKFRVRRRASAMDRGRPVAQTVSVDEVNALERLVAEGRIEPAHAKKQPAPKPVRAGSTVSDLLSDQRR